MQKFLRIIVIIRNLRNMLTMHMANAYYGFVIILFISVMLIDYSYDD